MELKTALMSFKFTAECRAALEKGAADQGISMTAYLEAAVDFIRGFPPGLMATLKTTAEQLKFPAGTVIANLLMVYVAQDAAITKHFGSRTWQRAFRMEPGKGLITDDSLSEMTFKEVDAEIESLKKKFKAADRKKEKVIHLTKEESALLALKFF